MQNNAESLFKQYWPYILFSLLAIILPFIWLKQGYLFVPEESIFINYQLLFKKYLYSWSSHLNGGSPATPWVRSTLIPNGFFYNILQNFGISNVLIQKFFIAFVLLFLFFASYKFLELFSKKKSVIVLGTLFYFLNFYVASTFFYSAKMYQMILMPLFFLFFYKYLKHCDLKYAIFNFLALFFFQGLFCNLPQLITTLVIYIFVLIYYLTAEETVRLKEITKKVVTFFIFLIPIFFYQFLLYYFSAYQKFAEIKEYATFTALRSPLYLLFQLRGSWWEYQGFDGVPYNYWLHFYDSPWIISISFLIIIICFSGFFKKGIKKRIIIFWTIVFLLFISLAKGTASPFGFVYNWLFYNFPLFCIFREPWAKFTPLVVLSLSVLLVLSVDVFKKKSLVFLVLILLLIRGIPFFSPNFFDHSNKGWKQSDIKIPSYWKKFSYWTTFNREKRLFILPTIKGANGVYQYAWYKKNIGNANLALWSFLSYSNNISNTSTYFSEVPKLINLVNNNTNLKILSLLNIDYFLDQGDVNTIDKKISIGIRYLKKNRIINNSPYKSFGKLDLYRISDEYFLPHIYSSTTPTVVSGDIETMVSMTETKYLGGEWEGGNEKGGKPVLLFTGQNKAFGSHIISHISHCPVANFVFKDSGWRDLAIQLAYAKKWEIEKGNWEIKETEEGEKYFELGKKFKLKDSGVYELWFDYSSLPIEKLPFFEIKVNGKEIVLPPLSKNSLQKYIKIGEMEIEKSGENKIQIISKDLELKDKETKIILVKKDELERVKKQIWQKVNNPETEIAYIFSKKEGRFYVP